MKKINIISVFLALAFLLLPISTIMMLHHITISKTIMDMDAGFFGESRFTIAVNDPNMGMPDICAIAANLNKDIAVYQDYTEPANVRSVFFSNKYVNMPMLSGRFFTAADFTPDNRIAVIGKNQEANTVTENGRRYISIAGEMYEVIGVLGMKENSAFDSRVFINGLTPLQNYHEVIYTFDYFCANGETLTSQIVAQTKAADVGSGTIEQQDSFLVQIIPDILTGRWFILIILCDLLCVILLSLEWRNRKKKAICIKRLLGYTPLRVVTETSARYLGLALSACLISLIVCTFLYPPYVRNMWLGLLVFLPCALLFTLGMNISLLKASIAEEIK